MHALGDMTNTSGIANGQSIYDDGFVLLFFFIISDLKSLKYLIYQVRSE